KARETMDIYAPLAGRMGMQAFREELEDLAFQVLNPEARRSVMVRFINLQRETGDVMDKIIADIRGEVYKAGLTAEVYGRAKKPYSIWRKMQSKQIPFSRLSDIYGFRVIVGSELECYTALGAIHQRWRAVPGRFKDYISQPKSNGYRSLHTTVSGRNARRVEVQIRTPAMHDVAETGVAATWSYRDGQRVENEFAVDPYQWMSSLTERFEGEVDDDEFLEAVKLEMYSDQVFCFTPKGDVVKLPKGATPLDFAYAVHTRVGNSTVSAKVDGIRVPLWTRLKNGQSVEIVTAEGQTPQPTWIDIVHTGRAKAAIRRSLREEDRERFVKLGRELIRPVFDRVGKTPTMKVLRMAATRLSMDDPREMLARVGEAHLSATDVLRAVYPDLAPAPDAQPEVQHAVLGLAAGQSFRRAPCCQPVPGERIVGITFRGQGVVVHAINCDNLAQYDDQPERWIDLRWEDGRHPIQNEVDFRITIANDAGVLGRICSLVGEQGANITNLIFEDRKPDFFRLELTVQVRDLDQLLRVRDTLAAETDVAEIERVRDPARLKGGGLAKTP
ncbi:MAG: RelA/SpoT family protein, partial [Shimia sp.]